jgi:hypothetical protein
LPDKSLVSKARGARRGPFALLCALAWALTGCEAHTGAPVVLAREVALYEDQPGRVQLGALRFEAGFVLSSADSAFGGFSGLWISPDGGELVTVSDHGTIWRAALEHEGDRLTGLADWRPTRLALDAAAGRIDAESLADMSGDLVIAVEGQEPLHRVARDDPGAPMRPLLAAGQLSEAGAKAVNGGIEALTSLPDGGLLALSEGVVDTPDQLAAWRISAGEGGIQRLGYAVSEGFVPTGADRLGQEIYAVERRFALVDGGFVARVVVFDAAQVEAGVPIRGRELARLAWPALGENFEGIAVRSGADGRVLLYLISDDNFLPIQRTLLLQFSLSG